MNAQEAYVKAKLAYDLANVYQPKKLIAAKKRLIKARTARDLEDIRKANHDH